ncbi:hypothetical protein ENBRE01_1035 [Enteropsectra breve]|nr:hypothetical protein ENBRE01_1035 [Enteropsectra breve]
MRIDDLQMEINHLMFLYYTIIGVIQRDSSTGTVYSSIEELCDEIVKCKERLDTLLQDNRETQSMPDLGVDKILKDAKEFLKNGTAFIDKIIE